MIERKASDYSNDIEILTDKMLGKVIKKTPRIKHKDPFWFWCEKIFGLHVRIDPGELITKSKKISELYEIKLPQIYSIKVNENNFSFLYEYITYNHVEEFNHENCKQYGEFIGKIHQKTFRTWGNMYDYSKPNDEFGAFIVQVIESNLETCYNTHKSELKKIFHKIKARLSRIELTESVMILLDVDADQYIYDDEGNITGIVDYEAIVTGPKEFELLMWEKYLGQDFACFLEGYKKFSDYNPKNIEIYKFLIFLFDSMGSDLDYYKWFGIKSYFRNVEIEVNNYCNRKCGYCPNSKSIVGKKEMSVEVYHKVIERLVDINFSGRMSYHFYNEPLLFSNLLEFIRYSQEKLPWVRKVLYSNGDNLTKGLLYELFDVGIDFFVITNHNPESSIEEHSFYKVYHELPEEMKNNLEYLTNSDLLLTNRGGALECDNKVDEGVKACRIPDSLIVIDVEGNVIPCYEDYYRTLVMGNVMNESLYDIWDNEDYQKMRNFLRHGKRKKYVVCKKCNNYTMEEYQGQYEFYK